MKKVKDYMTSEVISVSPETPVRDIIQLFIKKDISSVPVVDGKNGILGIVTEGDLLYRIQLPQIKSLLSGQKAYLDPDPLIYKYRRMGGKTAKEVMSENSVVVGYNEPVEAAIGAMIENRIRCLPVVRGEKVVGIISRIDLMRYLMEKEREFEKFTLSDPEIADLAASVLKMGIKFEISDLKVSVEKGNVLVTGTADFPVDAKEIKDLLSSIRGVKNVEIELIAAGLLS